MKNIKQIADSLNKLKKIVDEAKVIKTVDMTDDAVGSDEWKFKFIHEPGHYEVITMKSFDDLKDLFDETKEELVLTFDETKFTDEDKMNEVDGVIMPKSKMKD